MSPIRCKVKPVEGANDWEPIWWVRVFPFSPLSLRALAHLCLVDMTIGIFAPEKFRFLP